MTHIDPSQIQPPRGLLRLTYRLPVWFYRLGLGWLMGKRFLYLQHVGRKSGLLRHAVIEVIYYDQAADTYFLVAAYGEKADWLRNIRKTPQVSCQVGGRRFQARAEQLSPEQGEQQIMDYAHRHPTAIRALVRLIGYRIEGTEEDYRQLGRVLPVVAVRPL